MFFFASFKASVNFSTEKLLISVNPSPANPVTGMPLKVWGELIDITLSQGN